MVEPTDADREAAAKFTGDAVHYGHLDELDIVQAFATHRLAARAELLAELSEPTEAMVEAGRSAFYRAVGYSTEGDIGDGIKDAFRAMIAKAGE